MDAQVQKGALKFNRKNVFIISFILFLLVVIAISCQMIYTVLKDERIYKGVQIGETDVSGMTREALRNWLENNYLAHTRDGEITLSGGGASHKVTYGDLEVAYDVERAIEQAYGIGRTGNVFQRLGDILGSSIDGEQITVPFSLDEKKLDRYTENLYNRTLMPVKEAELTIQPDMVTLRSGRHGERIDRPSLHNEINKLIARGKSGSVDIPMLTTKPAAINVDELLQQIDSEAAEANIVIENGQITVSPHAIGRKIDRAVLSDIIAGLEKEENAEKVLPVAIIQPKLKTEEVWAKLFNDTLSSYTTQFYTSSQIEKNRGNNIKLALDKISGKILAPGEIFSFNETVGPRTAEGGYTDAYVYVNGQVVPGIGGGICQVSSTLYAAALFADMAIEERMNHMFTVAYMPLGRDAAVAYGTVDFRFKNTTAWPLKIEGWITADNRITFVLKGTDETPGKTVEITHKTVKETNFATKYIDDPAMDEGVTSVKQKGGNGYVVDTFKTVKMDGTIISQGKIHTSTYRPLDMEVIRGTRAVEIPVTQPEEQLPAEQPATTSPPMSQQPDGVTSETQPLPEQPPVVQ